MQKKQLIVHKPAYRRGQLLLEDDFIDEQQFHVHARYAHSRELHGFGVVRGLELSRAGDLSITISPGFAIDRKGREIEMREAQTLELTGLPPGALAWATIGYRTEQASREGEPASRIDCYAVVRAETGVEQFDVRLGSLQLDERGRIAPEGVDHAQRDVLRTRLATGSVGPEALDAQLRRDWITMAFHPSPMPADEDGFRPPFRIGATQAVAHEDWDGKPNTRGAAGTMTIALPPGVRHLHRFRIAGGQNDAALTATLLLGGFDPKTMKHVRDELLTLKVGKGAYFETGEIPESHRRLDDRHRTLAVDLRAEGLARVSLIAVEVSY